MAHNESYSRQEPLGSHLRFRTVRYTFYSYLGFKAKRLTGEVHTDNGRVEVVTEVAFQYRLPAANDGSGCSPVM
jgi:hypothetical protein